jgi:hypothetical protein
LLETILQNDMLWMSRQRRIMRPAAPCHRWARLDLRLTWRIYTFLAKRRRHARACAVRG